MKWKKIGKALLFPPMAVMVILLPVAVVLLVGSMVFFGEDSPVAIVSYVVAAYTLTVWCCKIPDLVRAIKRVREGNKYVRMWFDDARLRSSITLYGSSVWNVVYALFQLWLGFYHRTFWFASLGVYYLCLAAMRIYLVTYLRKNKADGQAASEWKRYRACGWIFLALNTALALIIFFMVYWNRTFQHHMITAIAMAAYTFTAFTLAIVNLVKYRKYNSPVLSAGKAISLAAACVSMLTLESTMLTTFSDGSMTLGTRRVLLGVTGAVISVFIIVAAVYMIIRSTKKIKEETQNGKSESAE